MSKQRLPLRKIGFIIKHHQPRAAALGLKLATILCSKGAAIALGEPISQSLKTAVAKLRPKPRVVSKEKLITISEAIVVLGGDGTLLSIARLIGGRNVPILGINMGQLGFLTETKEEEAFDAIERLLTSKRLNVSERALLSITVKRRGKTVFNGLVVNDAVISKGAIARMIQLQVLINRQPVNQIRADGLILSTPTGSTAYSLAAGGPIIEPTLGAILLTPICPHSLTHRTVVVSEKSVIEVQLQDSPDDVLLTLDGQEVVHLHEGDQVYATRYAHHHLKLISSPTRPYFRLLKEKLQFGLRG